jgi:hypothetical protein
MTALQRTDATFVFAAEGVLPGIRCARYKGLNVYSVSPFIARALLRSRKSVSKNTFSRIRPEQF